MPTTILKADALLAAALAASAKRDGIALTIVMQDCRLWATATFTGARHELVATAADTPELADWLGNLPEAELPIRGHLVADVVVMGVSRADGTATIRLEALTVEE